MSISKSMSGTPWHAERVHRAEGDQRRYKGRCAHYSYQQEFCKKFISKCTGSAHCDYYESISEEEFKTRQKMIQKGKGNGDQSGEDDSYWY